MLVERAGAPAVVPMALASASVIEDSLGGAAGAAGGPEGIFGGKAMSNPLAMQIRDSPNFLDAFERLRGQSVMTVIEIPLLRQVLDSV